MGFGICAATTLAIWHLAISGYQVWFAYRSVDVIRDSPSRNITKNDHSQLTSLERFEAIEKIIDDLKSENNFEITMLKKKNEKLEAEVTRSNDALNALNKLMSTELETLRTAMARTINETKSALLIEQNRTSERVQRLNDTLTKRINETYSQLHKRTKEITEQLLKTNSTFVNVTDVINKRLIKLNVTAVLLLNSSNYMNQTLMLKNNQTRTLIQDVNTSMSNRMERTEQRMENLNETVLSKLNAAESNLAKRIKDEMHKGIQHLSQRTDDMDKRLNNSVDDVIRTLDLKADGIQKNASKHNDVIKQISMQTNFTNSVCVNVSRSLNITVNRGPGGMEHFQMPWDRIDMLNLTMVELISDVNKTIRTSQDLRISNLTDLIRNVNATLSENIKGNASELNKTVVALDRNLKRTRDDIGKFRKRLTDGESDFSNMKSGCLLALLCGSVLLIVMVSFRKNW